MTALRAALDAEGFACIARFFSDDECENAVRIIEPLCRSAGARDMLKLALVRTMASRLSGALTLAGVLDDDAVCVQCTLFAKTPEANWSVAPHQDLSIPVAGCVDAPGYAGWSVKDGVWFVQPPASLLESMVAARLQLDAPSEGVGALRVFPSTHRRGRLDPTAITRATRSGQAVECAVPRGGALLLRPLCVHSSGKAKPGAVRRVLHFLFAPRVLPHGLQWADAV